MSARPIEGSPRPDGHQRYKPIWKKKDAKAHEVVTEWECECGARVNDVKAHCVAVKALEEGTLL